MLSPAQHHWIERWMVWLPGVIGAASFTAGSVMQMATSTPSTEVGVGPAAGAPAGECRVGGGGSGGGAADAERSAEGRGMPRTDSAESLSGAVGTTTRATTPTGSGRSVGYEECDFDTVLTHPQDVAVAAVAKFVQGPLNLLASVAFLDGSWLEFPAVFGFGDFGAAAAAAEAATDLSESAAGVASAAVDLRGAATDTYVVSNGLAGLEDLRDELFSSHAHHYSSPSCDGEECGGVFDAAAHSFGNAVASGGGGDTASSAAHVIGGVLFLVSSVAWIVELRAERRLKCSVGDILAGAVPPGLDEFGFAPPKAEEATAAGAPAAAAAFSVNLVGSEVGRKGRTRTLGERLGVYGERLTTYGRGLMMSQWNRMAHWK
jgi:hypothetical protein